MRQVSIVKIGQHVVELLNSDVVGVELDAAFRLTPIVKLPDARRYVYVVPKKRVTTTEGKSFDRRERLLNIVIQKRMTKPDTEGLELLELSEQIEDLITDRANRTFAVDGINFHFQKLDTDYLYVPTLAKTENQFLSVATATYFALE